MFRAQPVVSPILDIAEKSRAYERHTYALIHNVHIPIATQPPIAPSVQVFRRRRDKEREFSIKEDKVHSRTIDNIFKRQHKIPIPDDITTVTKNTRIGSSSVSTRSMKRGWSSLLKEKEADFPSAEERKKGKSQSLNKVDFRAETPQSTFREPESGMKVNYGMRSKTPNSPKREEKQDLTLNLKEEITSELAADKNEKQEEVKDEPKETPQGNEKSEVSGFQVEDSVTVDMEAKPSEEPAEEKKEN